MLKPILITASLTAFFLSTVPVQAGGLFGIFKNTPDITIAASEMPPNGYQSQWWTNTLGCTYSRTGRPGETSWTAYRHTLKRGCALYFVQVPWDGKRS